MLPYNHTDYGFKPYGNDQINLQLGSYNPSTVKPCNNMAYLYWSRSLYQRLCSNIIFDTPEEWEGSPKDLFKWCIFNIGYLGVMKTEDFGIVFNPGGLYGYDFYYQPTQFILANPKLNERYTIGKDCELLKLTPDYRGVLDIVSYFAEKLALLDNSINVSLINSKFTWVLGAKTKGAAAALRKMFDKINRGDPTVIYDQRITDDPASKDTPFQFLERRTGAKDNYLTSDQLRDVQTLLNAFDSEIGIQTIPYQKAERMVTAEANSRINDAQARAELWVDTFNESAKRVNKMFGINVKASIRKAEGLENGADTSNDINL